jgi:hypothetical protein
MGIMLCSATQEISLHFTADQNSNSVFPNVKQRSVQLGLVFYEKHYRTMQQIYESNNRKHIQKTFHIFEEITFHIKTSPVRRQFPTFLTLIVAS